MKETTRISLMKAYPCSIGCEKCAAGESHEPKRVYFESSFNADPMPWCDSCQKRHATPVHRDGHEAPMIECDECDGFGYHLDRNPFDPDAKKIKCRGCNGEGVIEDE